MLRGQASLQDIIGKPQSWRSGKSKQRNKKSIFTASDEAPEVRVKDEAAAHEWKPFGAAEAYNSKQHASVKSEPLPDTSADQLTPSQAPILRRSPRKAQTLVQQSAEYLLYCPVCSRTLPASMVEINRHIGKLQTS